MRYLFLRTVPLSFALLSLGSQAGWTQDSVEQWGIFELTLKGPTNGNPLVDTHFSARFAWDLGDSAATEVAGFYDGDGNYRVRFMPPTTGGWRYRTVGNVPQLDGKTGQFT